MSRNHESYDFAGWATVNNIRCSDGRTIQPGSFSHQNGTRVPLVWNHGHDSVSNVLGHADLEERPEGVYAYCKFNNSPSGLDAKESVINGDVNSLSIFANKLKQVGANVVHGDIREVSLVLARANPGAYIEEVMAHSDNDDVAAVIYSVEDEFELYHSEDEESEPELAHNDEASNEAKEEEKDMAAEAKEEKTVQDVIDSMTDEQKDVMYALVGQALEEGMGAEDEEDDDSEGEEEMKHNVFDNEMEQDTYLAHSEEFQNDVIGDAKRFGSMKESFLQHSAEYGVDNIDWLMPEYKNIDGNGAPNFIKRQPDGWVDVVMNGVHHTPFARIKMMFADLREDEARAKGYMKGKLKKEEVFGLLKRTVDPTTVYKKQKFDRDDVVDITDFDIIAWVKGEMRMMLDEELARAYIYGDGRTAMSEDKISESNIIPVWKDADLYCIKKVVTPQENESTSHAIISAAVKAQDEYEGSGNITAFMKASDVSDMLLLEDAQGHRMYKDIKDLALAMGVERIVKVPASIVPATVYAVMLDLRDYNVGADKGGAINMFDDFDIDYNQQKYLIETRCSGALIKPYSAIVLKSE